MENHLILNPGSTSTKIAISQDGQICFQQTIRHSQQELSQFSSIVEQKAFRAGAIVRTLDKAGYAMENITGVIAIGGLIRPGDAGVYKVNQDMVNDLLDARYDEHAANLGALIAYDIAGRLKIDAYIADPITADEMDAIARISGMPEIVRLGRSHTLNQKSVAAAAAKELNKPYAQANLVVAHLGGGISVTAHRYGRMVDTNSARGEGPFCIDRTGGLNAFDLARLCFSGKYTKEEMLKKINGNGGVVAYLNTRDFKDVVQMRAQDNQLALDIFDAMAYQVAKEIAAMSVPLGGRLDAIVLTGGMANSKELIAAISGRVAYLGKVMVFPGEQEMEALAEYLRQIVSGERQAIQYVPEEDKK